MFGRTCCNPRTYIPVLLEKFRTSYYTSYDAACFCGTAAVSALLELSKRCEDVHEHAEELAEWAQQSVDDFDGYADVNPIFSIYVRVLNVFGDLTDQHRLEKMIHLLDEGEARYQFEEDEDEVDMKALEDLRQLPTEVAAALGFLHANGPATRAIKPSANEGVPFPAAENTDLALEQALWQSEEYAVQQEQSELTEALLRSKCQISHASHCEDNETTGLEDRLVLLSFTRFPKEFRDALLASQLEDQGADLEPNWATPALILALGVTEHDVSEACALWHLAVHVRDEDEVHEIRLRFCSKARPRVKGRFLVPVRKSSISQK